MTDFKQLLHLLSTSKVDFILVGGMAATVHGATRLTQDLDIVYSRSRANLERLAAALAPYQPYLREQPAGRATWKRSPSWKPSSRSDGTSISSRAGRLGSPR